GEPPLERPQLSEGVVAEVIEIDFVAPVRCGAKDVAERVNVRVAAEGSERHHLSFIGKVESQVLRDERVNDPEGVEDACIPKPLQLVSAAHIGAGRSIVTEAVHHENGGLVEGAHEENRGMSVMMGDIDDRRQLVDAELTPELPREK